MKKLINHSVTENNNGVKTHYVLFDDGTIYSRLETNEQWQEERSVDVPGYRNNNGSLKNTSSGNKKSTGKG